MIWRNKLLGVVLIIIGLFFIPTSSRGQQIKVHVLDVGQGDSILIELPDSYYVLIDGGPNGKVLDELSEVLPFWERKIDTIMLTHPDSDHVSGLVDVLRSYDVVNVYTTGISGDSAAYATFSTLIQEYGLKSKNFGAGHSLKYAGEIQISGYWPQLASKAGGSSSSPGNYNSQVGMLRFGNFELLLTGDIDTSVAAKILNENNLSYIDVLKVPHHGSKYGISLGDLKKISPKASIISAGKDNPYGHPAKETLDSLRLVGSDVHQTKQRGRVTIVADSAGFSVHSR